MINIRQDAYNILQKDVWFLSLPEDLRQHLAFMAMTRSVRAKRTIFSKGDPSTGIYGLVSGKIIVKNEGILGEDGILASLDPPFWFGEIGLFDGLPRTHNIVALDHSTFIYIPLLPLQTFLNEFPVYWKNLAHLLTQKMRLSFFAIDDLTNIATEVKVARRILMMALGWGASTEVKLTIDLPQEHLAQMLGVSRTTINPVLRHFTQEKVLKSNYGKIVVLDLEKLKRLARYDSWLPTHAPS